MANDTLNSVYSEVEQQGEKLIAWIWQHQRLRPGLATTDGESLRVVFPGRRNGLGGPDFRQAILATPQQQLRGDVELHIRSSQWQAHGHHRDPAYNSVVLHVVMWNNSTAPNYLQNGRWVPTLALSPYLLGQGEAEVHREPCQQPRYLIKASTLGQLLDDLGEARFMAKAALFRGRLKEEGAAQVLYEGIMAALGYSRNQEAFQELARRFPLAEAEAVARFAGWQGVLDILLERAGLASSLSRRDPPREAAMPVYQGIAPLNAIQWQRQGVRPGNQPGRRLAAISHLLERYATEGLLPGLMAAVERAACKENQRELESALMMPAEVDKVATTKCRREPALLGRSRVGEIVVNILLPFVHAYGLRREALQLYRSYPPLEENEITREMSELLGTGRKSRFIGACRQQGLIHLFKEFCAERRCQACPLGGVQGK